MAVSISAVLTNQALRPGGHRTETKLEIFWEVVVAQLVEQLLPIPEVHGSNPVFGKIHIEHLFTCLLSTVLKRRK